MCAYIYTDVINRGNYISQLFFICQRIGSIPTHPIRTDYRHLFKPKINGTIVSVQIYNHVALCFVWFVGLL
jgi:hypothetical protein